MNDWNLDQGEWRDSNPYGKKIQDFIMKYPEWVIYLRKDERFKCPRHYDLASKSFKSFGFQDCGCWGLGVAVSGVIVPSKISRGRNSEVGPLDGEVKDSVGYLDYFQDVVHLPRAVLPQINDFILGCEWNTKAQKIHKFPPRSRPIRIHTVYIIRQTNAYFQRELSHISCGVESFNIQANLMSSFIEEKLANLPIWDVDTTWKSIDYWNS